MLVCWRAQIRSAIVVLSPQRDGKEGPSTIRKAATPLLNLVCCSTINAFRASSITFLKWLQHRNCSVWRQLSRGAEPKTKNMPQTIGNSHVRCPIWSKALHGSGVTSLGLPFFFHPASVLALQLCHVVKVWQWGFLILLLFLSQEPAWKGLQALKMQLCSFLSNATEYLGRFKYLSSLIKVLLQLY